MSCSEHMLAHLRCRGYRLTPQRLAILHIIKESNQHLTPAQVFERARHALPGLTEPTVYRNLAFLVEQDLVTAAHMGKGQIVYEYAGAPHHHLICRGCGHMLEVGPEALELLFHQFSETTGFKVDTPHLTFFGLCPGCQE